MFTRFGIAKFIKDKTSGRIIEVLDEWIKKYDKPKEILVIMERSSQTSTLWIFVTKKK